MINCWIPDNGQYYKGCDRQHVLSAYSSSFVPNSKNSLEWVVITEHICCKINDTQSDTDSDKCVLVWRLSSDQATPGRNMAMEHTWNNLVSCRMKGRHYTTKNAETDCMKHGLWLDLIVHTYFTETLVFFNYLYRSIIYVI